MSRLHDDDFRQSTIFELLFKEKEREKEKERKRISSEDSHDSTSPGKLEQTCITDLKSRAYFIHIVLRAKSNYTGVLLCIKFAVTTSAFKRANNKTCRAAL